MPIEEKLRLGLVIGTGMLMVWRGWMWLGEGPNWIVTMASGHPELGNSQLAVETARILIKAAIETGLEPQQVLGVAAAGVGALVAAGGLYAWRARKLPV